MQNKVVGHTVPGFFCNLVDPVDTRGKTKMDCVINHFKITATLKMTIKFHKCYFFVCSRGLHFYFVQVKKK